MFCRRCGYNLYGLPENRCPECGNKFDPSNAKTYDKHSSSISRRWWVKRIIVAMVAFVFLIGATGLSLWYPWHREQAAVRMVRHRRGDLATRMIGPPWLQKLLGGRGRFLLARIDLVDLNFSTTLMDADLAALEGLPELKFLCLIHTRVTDAGLLHLKNLRELVELDLQNTHVTDAGLAHLIDLKSLHELNLLDVPVTDAGLVHLKELEELRALDLRGTHITDAGLVHLKGLKGLHYLHLYSTQVTDAGVAKLQQALPGCDITR